jgi:hypothetical protein
MPPATFLNALPQRQELGIAAACFGLFIAQDEGLPNHASRPPVCRHCELHRFHKKINAKPCTRQRIGAVIGDAESCGICSCLRPSTIG